jgi:hypothetical protein
MLPDIRLATSSFTWPTAIVAGISGLWMMALTFYAIYLSSRVNALGLLVFAQAPAVRGSSIQGPMMATSAPLELIYAHAEPMAKLFLMTAAVLFLFWQAVQVYKQVSSALPRGYRYCQQLFSAPVFHSYREVHMRISNGSLSTVLFLEKIPWENKDGSILESPSCVTARVHGGLFPTIAIVWEGSMRLLINNHTLTVQLPNNITTTNATGNLIQRITTGSNTRLMYNLLLKTPGVDRYVAVPASSRVALVPEQQPPSQPGTSQPRTNPAFRPVQSPGPREHANWQVRYSSTRGANINWQAPTMNYDVENQPSAPSPSE